VAEFRDSKALRSKLPEIVCLRSIRDGCLLWDGRSVPTTGLTKEHGVFSFTLGDTNPYTLRRDCAMVENVAVFHSFEELGLNASLAIHVHLSSKRFLDSLASNVEQGLRVLHFPDYALLVSRTFCACTGDLARQSHCACPPTWPLFSTSIPNPRSCGSLRINECC
jgi:hypothetical protein